MVGSETFRIDRVAEEFDLSVSERGEAICGTILQAFRLARYSTFGRCGSYQCMSASGTS
jgi:hypothetical protein